MSYNAREIKKMNKLANSKEVKKLRAIQDWAIDEEERLGEIERLASKTLLTTSARDYLESMGEQLNDYRLLGVNVVYTEMEHEVGLGDSSALINKLVYADFVNDVVKKVLKKSCLYEFYNYRAVIDARKAMIDKAKTMHAEVVVDLKTTISRGNFLEPYNVVEISGTALVPDD